MCILAIQYKSVPEAPILVAANRDEFYERPSTTPSIQAGKPRILGGVDQQSGGTWLGVNQHGLFVAACNRRKSIPPVVPRSRGILCRELLRSRSAAEAISVAMEELSSNRYEGVNYVIADGEAGWVIHGTNEPEVVALNEGLNVISNRNLNDPRDERCQLAKRLLTLQRLDSPVKFLAVASKVFARSPSSPMRPSMVIRNNDRGTVSSTLIALGLKPRDAIYQFSSGAPDENSFEDYSPMLRDILSRGLREAKLQAATV